MYRISNKDRQDLLALLQLMQGYKPEGLREQNRLRRARAALKKLQRSQQT
jgi:hypothetical protein